MSEFNYINIFFVFVMFVKFINIRGKFEELKKFNMNLLLMIVLYSLFFFILYVE